jgi:protein-S-isoprenylcysteine O-methyltransferase Ste14
MEISTGIANVASSAEPQLAKSDVPAIIAPGPWIAFSTLAFGSAFDSLHVIRVLADVPTWCRGVAGVLLIALGAWYIIRANVIFRREQTPFQPWRPTRTIAAQDIYARTRNPMYQGFLILVLGLAVLLRSDWTVLFLMPAAMLIHYGVVLREEHYLDRRFGESYRAYMAAVPRYGWAFAGFSQALPKP